jgi:hypothetical protein
LCPHMNSLVGLQLESKEGSIQAAFVPAPRLQTECKCRHTSGQGGFDDEYADQQLGRLNLTFGVGVAATVVTAPAMIAAANTPSVTAFSGGPPRA